LQGCHDTQRPHDRGRTPSQGRARENHRHRCYSIGWRGCDALDKARNGEATDGHGAYRAKYRRHERRYVDPMVAPAARATTIKLVPRAKTA